MVGVKNQVQFFLADQPFFSFSILTLSSVHLSISKSSSQEKHSFPSHKPVIYAPVG